MSEGTINISLHRVTGIEVKSYHPTNSHAVKLRILHAGGAIDLLLFGMTEDVAISTIAGLDHRGAILHGDKIDTSVEQYLTVRKVINAMTAPGLD